jgi:hypothetical protein
VEKEAVVAEKVAERVVVVAEKEAVVAEKDAVLAVVRTTSFQLFSSRGYR